MGRATGSAAHGTSAQTDADAVLLKLWVAQDPQSRKIAEIARKVALTSTTVLVRGESGTGKDLLGTVKLSRICPFCGRILLDQRLRINDLAVAAGGENAAKLLNLTVPSESTVTDPDTGSPRPWVEIVSASSDSISVRTVRAPSSVTSRSPVTSTIDSAGIGSPLVS